MNTEHQEDRGLRLWSPALRRAVMKVRPEYFSWPVERRERYVVAMPVADALCLDHALLLQLFGRTVPRGNGVDECLSPAEQHRWNETVLPLEGIGEDCFFLNEVLAEQQTLLDFETVRDLDEADHRFQEATRRRVEPGYAGRPYHGALYMTWARLYLDGRFTYATLSMAAGYLYSEIVDSACELLQERIPHRYVRGRDHGKRVGEQRQWDMHVDAGGQEQVFHELQRRVWAYQEERYEALLAAWDGSGRTGVYLVDESEPSERRCHIVFTDTGALARVRFRTFVRDCRNVERDAAELILAVEKERGALARFLAEQHAEILAEQDPKLVKLRRRSQVLLMPGLFDELDGPYRQ